MENFVLLFLMILWRLHPTANYFQILDPVVCFGVWFDNYRCHSNSLTYIVHPLQIAILLKVCITIDSFEIV